MEKQYKVDILEIIENDPNIDLYAVSFKQNLQIIRSIINDTIGQTIDHITQKEAITIYDSELEEYTMFINADKFEILQRLRFTLAHEYAHIQLQHFNQHQVILYRDANSQLNSKDKIELAANDYAANLLMPTESIRAMIADGKLMSDMIVEFEVSPEAMMERIVRSSDFNLK